MIIIVKNYNYSMTVLIFTFIASISKCSVIMVNNNNNIIVIIIKFPSLLSPPGISSFIICIINIYIALQTKSNVLDK